MRQAPVSLPIEGEEGLWPSAVLSLKLRRRVESLDALHYIVMRKGDRHGRKCTGPDPYRRGR